MKNNYGRYITICIAFCIIALILSGCFKKEKEKSKKLVLATTNIIADIASNIAGDFLEVQALMAPGMDPHLYRATQGDVVKLSGADVIFYNGLSLEGKMGEVLSRVSTNVPSYAVASSIPSDLLLFEGDQPDPHVWFDPNLWIYAVKIVADGIIDIDKENEIFYRKNEERYIQELLMLYESIKKELNTIPSEQRVLITSHDAFSYFGRAFGWEVIGIQGINTASETSVYNLQKLSDFIVERNVHCIFTETSVSDRSVNAIVSAVESRGAMLNRGKPLYSDSLGAKGSGADTYVTMIEANARNIISGIIGDEK